MYIPSHFSETDPVAIQDVISAYPLATIVTQTDDGMLANPIPVLFDGQDRLIGHVAMANDMHRVICNGTDVMALFQGPDAYISPNWYPSKAETHKAVPTWNYQCVQMHGVINFQHNTKMKRAVVGKMTQFFERAANKNAGWKMADAPRDYMQDMLDNIVAFEITVSRILSKSKLNQNRSDADQQAVADQLHARGKLGISDKMR